MKAFAFLNLPDPVSPTQLHQSLSLGKELQVPSPSQYRSLSLPSPIDARPRAVEVEDQDARWATWRAKGAAADAQTQHRIRWFAAALLGGSGLWLAFQILSSGVPS